VTDVSAGQRLRSQACATEVIVVRAPDHQVELTCGGQPMASDQAIGAGTASGAGTAGTASGASAASGEGTRLGKRYVDESTGLEVLCVKPGDGTLAADGRDLTLKSAKPLPASD
jgi:hypothetical protein